MRNRGLFENVRVPEPPPELREKTVASAKNSFRLESDNSWLDRFWQNRLARFSWSISVAITLFFLLFWNPPLPGTHPLETEAHVAVNGEIQMRSLRVSVYNESLADFRAIQGGDL